MYAPKLLNGAQTVTSDSITIVSHSVSGGEGHSIPGGLLSCGGLWRKRRDYAASTGHITARERARNLKDRILASKQGHPTSVRRTREHSREHFREHFEPQGNISGNILGNILSTPRANGGYGMGHPGALWGKQTQTAIRRWTVILPQTPTRMPQPRPGPRRRVTRWCCLPSVRSTRR